MTLVAESPSTALRITTSGAAAQTGSRSGTEEAKTMSELAAEASAMTAWVNAVIVVETAAAAMVV